MNFKSKRILLFFSIALFASFFIGIRNEIIQKKQIEKNTKLKTSNNLVCDYLSINDDNTILKNKFMYYNFSDAIQQQQMPIGLKDFLIKEYYPNHNNQNACLQNATCSFDKSEFKYIFIDLQGDGNKEYIVMPWTVCGCTMRGASGNGDILVIRYVNNKFEVLGQLFGNGYVISKTQTNGYNDIITNNHSSAATGTEVIYKYQMFSNGEKTNGNYEEAFSKRYDFSRINQNSKY